MADDTVGFSMFAVAMLKISVGAAEMFVMVDDGAVYSNFEAPGIPDNTLLALVDRHDAIDAAVPTTGTDRIVGCEVDCDIVLGFTFTDWDVVSGVWLIVVIEVSDTSVDVACGVAALVH